MTSLRKRRWTGGPFFFFIALTLTAQVNGSKLPYREERPEASQAKAPITAARGPNVVLILMDNLGYGELGVYGGGVTRGAPTPRIDKLASEGIRFRTLQSIGAFCAHRCFSSPAA